MGVRSRFQSASVFVDSVFFTVLLCHDPESAKLLEVPTKHAQTRLKSDHVIWFTTCGRDGQQPAVPGWFWWDGKPFFIDSVPGQKGRDVSANPKATRHLS